MNNSQIEMNTPELAMDIPEQSRTQKIALATIVGTTIEWYDYFIYAAVAGLVFNQLFFYTCRTCFRNPISLRLDWY